MPERMDEALPDHSLNRQQFPPSDVRLRTALSCPSRTPLVLFQSPRSSNWIICSNSSCWRFSRFSVVLFFPLDSHARSVFWFGFPCFCMPAWLRQFIRRRACQDLVFGGYGGCLLNWNEGPRTKDQSRQPTLFKNAEQKRDTHSVDLKLQLNSHTSNDSLSAPLGSYLFFVCATSEKKPQQILL